MANTKFKGPWLELYNKYLTMSVFPQLLSISSPMAIYHWANGSKLPNHQHCQELIKLFNHHGIQIPSEVLIAEKRWSLKNKRK